MRKIYWVLIFFFYMQLLILCAKLILAYYNALNLGCCYDLSGLMVKQRVIHFVFLC